MATITQHPDSALPESISSPIRTVLDRIHLTVGFIAPERGEDFRELNGDFSLKIIDTTKWIFQVDTKSGIIEASTRAFEIIWIAAYAFLINFDIQKKAISESQTTSVPLSNFPELEKACNLLSWVLNCQINKNDSAWPVDLPSPDDDNENTFLASEIFRVAIGYLLLHEIMHCVFNHTERLIENEKEADSEAAKWVLKDIDSVSNELQFQKRGMGISLAFMVIAFESVYLGVLETKSHPAPFNRLVNTLDTYFDRDDFVWLYTALSLGLIVSNTIAQDDLEHSSVFEKICYYGDLIERHARGEVPTLLRPMD